MRKKLATLKQELDPVILHHGYGATVQQIAVVLLWNTRWYAPNKQARLLETGRMLMEAGKELSAMEAELKIDP